jgi:poly(A)-specific ribonuclease
MTSELFIKLGNKLYAERKHLLKNRDRDSDVADYAYSDDDFSSEGSGGAPLILPDSNHDIADPEWYSGQMNPYSVLKVEREDLPDTDQPNQWMPTICNAFWDIYANKLRVNASEGGICDLEERE